MRRRALVTADAVGLASASAIVGLGAAYRYEEPPAAAAGVSLFFAAVSLAAGRGLAAVYGPIGATSSAPT